MARWEQGLTRALLLPSEKGKLYVKFNVDGLLRGDYKSRMEGYSIGIQNGFMCPNDVRALEEWDLIPEDKGGDTFVINGNMLPLEMAGAYAAQQPPDEDESTDAPRDGGRKEQ